MKIALDAMGGDFAPETNVDGAIAALKAHPDLEVVLVGDQPALDSLVEKAGCPGDRLTVHPADGVIGMDEKPTFALRKKPNSSIAVCWRLMAGHEVDAVVSAGNTGAVVAAGLRTRLFLKGIKRPGIAVALPTKRGRSVLMDVGANPAARPEHLLQYGIMGRSEEHTSELQSRRNLVCRLLLEKKKYTAFCYVHKHVRCLYLVR